MAVMRRWKWIFGVGLGLCVLLLASLLIAVRLTPLPLDVMVKSYSTLVYDQNGKLLRGFLSSDDKWRLPVTVDNVAPAFEQILLAYEDRWYYWHPGVNPGALIRALFQNVTAGRVISGGSTLTMQVAHLLEPKARTFPNKCKEIFRALQLEMRYTKREILEMYYNLAPFGGNIEGVRAASLLYFGKSPNELTTGEAALLAALPNSPERLRPDKYPERALAARNKVLSRALQFGAISEEQYRRAIQEEIPRTRRAFPFEAPHLMKQVRQSSIAEDTVITTIDLELQHNLEQLLRKHTAAESAKGVANGAVVVIDNRNHTIPALIGSLDFFSDEIIGEVNQALVRRSIGPMLQPFVYALALDRGLITPKRYVEDVPIRLDDYVPKNLSGMFSGLLKADYALVQSLNAPAVDLLYQLGSESLSRLLQKAGVTTVAAENRYGLTTALGDVSVDLLALTMLYSAFATQGKMWHSSYVTGTDPVCTELVSEEAAYLVTTILAQHVKPDLPKVEPSARNLPVAWKSGTSVDYRSAWSIGYNRNYTVGVWIGNFSGRGAAALAGEETATALLFDILAVLTDGKAVTGDKAEMSWFSMPSRVRTRWVCSLSGQVPGPYCEQTIKDFYIPGVSSDRECDLHQVVWVNAAGEYALGDPDKTSSFQRVGYVKWPERTATWLKTSGQVALRLTPEGDASFRSVSSSEDLALRIVSPMDNQVYQIKKNLPWEYQTVALDAVADDATVLYWFLDGELIGCAPPGQKVFYTPLPGKHVVVCHDDRGRSSKITFTVAR